MGREKEGGNKAGYMATLVGWGWAGAVLKKVTRASGQEPYASKAKKRQKSNSHNSVTCALLAGCG